MDFPHGHRGNWPEVAGKEEDLAVIRDLGSIWAY